MRARARLPLPPRMIKKQADTVKIRKQALSDGMVTLKQDGI